MAIAYVTYTEDYIKGKAHNPEDRYSSREDSFVNYQADEVFSQKPSSLYYDRIHPKEDLSHGENIYLVVVVYDSGDTFGTTRNHGVPFNAYRTRGEAESAQEAIYVHDALTRKEKHVSSLMDGSKELQKLHKTLESYKNTDVSYWEWIGHFERLTNVLIIERTFNDY